MDRNLISIYLNDHLAGATAGVELARRARASNEGTELGDFLARLAAEIEEDRATLERIMDSCGIGRDRLKLAAAWSAEKLGRLKLNGSVRSYAPLSRLVELEGLYLGITGKLSLWESLRASLATELAEFDLQRLIERAERQRSELEPYRLAAAREALGATVGSAERA